MIPPNLAFPSRKLKIEAAATLLSAVKLIELAIGTSLRAGYSVGPDPKFYYGIRVVIQKTTYKLSMNARASF